MTKLPEWANSLRAQLVVEEGLEKSDLIFVLAGHPSRKHFGAKLFADGWAPRILMSTGNPSFIAEVLGYSAAASQPTTDRGHFFAYFDHESWTVQPISVGWFGTLSEIREFAKWLRRRAFVGKVTIVSVGTHLRRVSLCCRTLLPERCVVRYAAVNIKAKTPTAERIQPESETASRVLVEAMKLWAYRFLLLFVRRPDVLPSKEED